MLKWKITVLQSISIILKGSNSQMKCNLERFLLANTKYQINFNRRICFLKHFKTSFFNLRPLKWRYSFSFSFVFFDFYYFINSIYVYFTTFVNSNLVYYFYPNKNQFWIRNIINYGRNFKISSWYLKVYFCRIKLILKRFLYNYITFNYITSCKSFRLSEK